MSSNRFLKLTSGVYNTRNNCGVSLAGAMTDLDFIKTKVEDLNKELTNLDNDVDGNKNKILTIEEQTSGFSSAIARLNTLTEDNQSRITAVENRASNLESSLATTNTLAENNQTRITQTEKDIVDVDTTLTENVTLLSEQIKTINTKITGLENNGGSGTTSVPIYECQCTSSFIEFESKIYNPTPTVNDFGDYTLDVSLYTRMNNLHKNMRKLELSLDPRTYNESCVNYGKASYYMGILDECEPQYWNCRLNVACRLMQTRFQLLQINGCGWVQNRDLNVCPFDTIYETFRNLNIEITQNYTNETIDNNLTDLENHFADFNTGDQLLLIDLNTRLMMDKEIIIDLESQITSLKSKLETIQNNDINESKYDFIINPVIKCPYEDHYIEVESTIFSETLDSESLNETDKELLTNYINLYKKYKFVLGSITRTLFDHDCESMEQIYQNEWQALKTWITGKIYNRIVLGCFLMDTFWAPRIGLKTTRRYMYVDSDDDCPFNYLMTPLTDLASIFDLNSNIISGILDTYNQAESKLTDCIESYKELPLN